MQVSFLIQLKQKSCFCLLKSQIYLAILEWSGSLSARFSPTNTWNLHWHCEYNIWVILRKRNAGIEWVTLIFRSNLDSIHFYPIMFIHKIPKQEIYTTVENFERNYSLSVQLGKISLIDFLNWTQLLSIQLIAILKKSLHCWISIR